MDDPTLLFTNAGMNQFKPIFLGQEKREYTRAVNTQKCIRAGGKHNDLDDVGRSRRHHTFFEMLGNWSFGDYFKRGAIAMSWELLTTVWGLDPSRMHVSCFEGDERNGVPRDFEAAELWKEIAGLPDEQIHFFGKDNFWEMGDTGPCGPCTEIYIDRTPDKSGGPLVNGDDPRVMEIWNNVFIQYNRNPDRSLVTLPSQHVDTGMGFERITQVLQDKHDNYAIDLFDPFWAALKDLSGISYGGRYPATNVADPLAESRDADLRHDIALRVIADHIRCLTFALTDGALPGNEGRGYVLRRILRRAVRFGRQQLELDRPFLHALVPVVVDAMGDAFAELKRDPASVAAVIKDEEISFGRTLDRGIELFAEAASRARGATIAGDDAFKLHDTFGFPIDLTQVMAGERGMTVDVGRYEQLMDEAREKARAGGRVESAFTADLPPDAIARLQGEKIAATNDQAKFTALSVDAEIRAIWDGSLLVDRSMGQCAVILNHTCFYAEMGGQVGDCGTIETAGGGKFNVRTTRAVGPYILHIGEVTSGELRVGDRITAAVAATRQATMRNHTGTHLANWALREVLGEAVQQKGSLVDPEKLRFDFSHGKALSEAEVGQIESRVRSSIDKRLTVYAEEAPQDEALRIHGLRAVFGEKYPPKVRVVSVGAPVRELLADAANPRWRDYSIEFCGGTHLSNAAEVEAFTIVAEESVSKGIRRITALTGEAGRRSIEIAQRMDEEIARLSALAPDALSAELGAFQKLLAAPGLGLLARRRGQAALGDWQSRVKAWEKSKSDQGPGGATVDVGAEAAKQIEKAIDVGGAKLVIGEIPGASDEQLRSVIDSIRQRAGNCAVLLASAREKVALVAAVSDDLIARGLKAGDWVREAAKAAGGGGGGRPQMAQAGGKDPAKLPASLAAARKHAADVLGAAL